MYQRWAEWPCERLCGRSVLAEAVLAALLASSLGLLPVEVESASLGPAFEGDHDQCILQARAP